MSDTKSKDLYERLRNQVRTTTGCDITDEAIDLIASELAPNDVAPVADVTMDTTLAVVRQDADLNPGDELYARAPSAQSIPEGFDVRRRSSGDIVVTRLSDMGAAAYTQDSGSVISVMGWLFLDALLKKEGSAKSDYSQKLADALARIADLEDAISDCAVHAKEHGYYDRNLYDRLEGVMRRSRKDSATTAGTGPVGIVEVADHQPMDRLADPDKPFRMAVAETDPGSIQSLPEGTWLFLGPPASKADDNWTRCSEAMPEVVRDEDDAVNAVIGLYKPECEPDGCLPFLLSNAQWFQEHGAKHCSHWMYLNPPTE